MNKIFIVARREYSRMIKSKAFWFATLLVPVMIVVIGLIESSSNAALTNKLASEVKNAKSIYLLDDSGTIAKDQLKSIPHLVIPADYNTGVTAVKDLQADVFIYYPKDILTSDKIDIVTQDKGILSAGTYDGFATDLLKQNILAGITDPKKIELFNANLTVNTTLYNNGTEVPSGIERYILPLAAVLCYFLFSSIASGYLLQSVSEEKENRMIEIVLSVLKPRDLILGKVIGQVGAILTQILVLILLGVVALKVTGMGLPINVSALQINPGQLLLSLVYLFAGFLIMAFTMVGVGAAMPTYREANSFSAIFIMLSILPIYFATSILADPTGPLAVGLSFFPYTAPIILMLRNALNALPPLQIALSIVVLFIYIMGISFVAYKMFEFGAMEYSQKVSFKDFFKTKFGPKKALNSEA